MEILKFDLNNPDQEVVGRAGNIIKSGGVVVFPTDTVYGLAVNALDENAVKKLFAIKMRDAKKPVSIIVESVKLARVYTAISKKAETILEKLFPGPVTVILRKKEKLPDILTAGGDTVGVRIPSNTFTALLAAELEFPYTATSANISGEPPSGKIDDVKKIFSESELEPDLLIDAGDLAPSEPSTVIDLAGERPQILRTGPLSKERLFEIIKSLS